MHIDLTPIERARQLLSDVFPDVAPEIGELFRDTLDNRHYEPRTKLLELTDNSLEVAETKQQARQDLVDRIGTHALIMVMAAHSDSLAELGVPELGEKQQMALRITGLRQAVRARNVQQEWHECGMALRELARRIIAEEV